MERRQCETEAEGIPSGVHMMLCHDGRGCGGKENLPTSWCILITMRKTLLPCSESLPERGVQIPFEYEAE